MWSTLLLLVIAATSLPTALGYVSGPLPLYDTLSSSSPNKASSSAGAAVLDAVKVVQSPRRPPGVWPPKRELTGRPLQVPGVAGAQRHVPAGVMRPPKRSVINKPISTRRTKHEDMTSAIHFPTSDETRFKRQIGWQHPRFPFNTRRQGSFRGPQNNFGNSFDYPIDPPQWNGNGNGNGNGNANGNGRPNRPNFNGRPQQPNWGGSGGSQDYDEMPFVFDNGPLTQRPPRPAARPSRPPRPSVGNVNNNMPRPAGNARPVPNVRPTPPPRVTQAPVTQAPVTQAPVTPPTVTSLPMTPATTRAGCRCQETPEFNPVCGQDRVTYFNPSRLRCINSCGNRVEVLHLGSCITTTTPPPNARTWPTLLRRS